MALSPREIHPAPRPAHPHPPASKLANGRPRLSVFRSAKNIYAQIIDDAARRDRGATPRRWKAARRQGRRTRTPRPASASWSPSARIEKGVKDVVFDRGGYIYHGRVKALADAAREAGLNF